MKIEIGNATIEVTVEGYRLGRAQFAFTITHQDWTYSDNDLYSGTGVSMEEYNGLASLLSYLGAAAESYEYAQRTGNAGENSDLFPAHVVEWAASCSDELTMQAEELDLIDRVQLIDDGTLDTVLEIDGEELRYDHETGAEYRDEDGELDFIRFCLDHIEDIYDATQCEH